MTSSDKADTDTADAGEPEAGKAAAAGATDKASESTTTTDADAAADADDATAAGGEAATDADPEKPDSAATVGLSKSDAVAAEQKSDDATEKISAPDAKAGAGEKSDAEKPAGRGLPFPLPALIGAAVVLVAALVAVGVFFFLAGNKQEELDRRAAATKAACDFGNNFATYTGDKADDYLQRLDQSSTGKWKDLVAQIGPDLKTRFAESKVSSSATSVQCGYESGSGDEARVVLVIDQQFTTANVPQEQGPGQVKVAADVSMQKVDGTWLVADFDTPMMQQ
ncbi:hypothetical protein ACWCPQ_12510 [Nocardia sp. NPDC001965]